MEEALTEAEKKSEEVTINILNPIAQNVEIEASGAANANKIIIQDVKE